MKTVFKQLFCKHKTLSLDDVERIYGFSTFLVVKQMGLNRCVKCGKLIPAQKQVAVR